MSESHKFVCKPEKFCGNSSSKKNESMTHVPVEGMETKYFTISSNSQIVFQRKSNIFVLNPILLKWIRLFRWPKPTHMMDIPCPKLWSNENGWTIVEFILPEYWRTEVPSETCLMATSPAKFSTLKICRRCSLFVIQIIICRVVVFLSYIIQQNTM